MNTGTHPYYTHIHTTHSYYAHIHTHIPHRQHTHTHTHTHTYAPHIHCSYTYTYHRHNIHPHYHTHILHTHTYPRTTQKVEVIVREEVIIGSMRLFRVLSVPRKPAGHLIF